MCGIAGIFDLKAEREVDRDALRRMTDALIHRGPDGDGYYFAPGIGFGHRRLAIIDKEGGAQPFHAQTAQCVLSFNGEIYNYQTLAKSLSANVSLKTRSDTEALAEGLSLHGDRFIRDLQGMFAISHWDPRTKSLLLARDRLGERPLYYAQTPDDFLIFASEISALRASGLLNFEIAPEALADYFYYGYTPDPKSIYQGVLKLPAGHILKVRRGDEAQLQRYWKPEFRANADLNFAEATHALLDHIDRAVGDQMLSDVPLGAFLSGGVDSSGIVASMAQSGNSLVTCTIGFDDANHDETTFAREVAQRFQSQHFEHFADAEDTDLIDKVATAFGEPFADSSALPSYLVAKLAREHVTVALSGDGGDEIFAGYRRYPFHLAEERLRAMAPAGLRKAVFEPAGKLYPKLDWAPKPLRFKSTFQSLACSTAEGYAAAVAINFPDRAFAMMSAELRAALGDYHPQSVIETAMRDADTDDPLAQAQYVDLMTWLPGRMLTKVDRAAMAHSLEVRPPLLDHKLVEWAGALPADFKLHRGVGKRILKNSFEKRLSREFLSRKKQGFALPLHEWLRRGDQGPLYRLSTSKAWRECGYFDCAVVDQMARDHETGAKDCSQELWTVIMFDGFLRAQSGF